MTQKTRKVFQDNPALEYLHKDKNSDSFFYGKHGELRAKKNFKAGVVKIMRPGSGPPKKRGRKPRAESKPSKIEANASTREPANPTKKP